MGRESAADLERAALTFLSEVNPNGELEAALFLRRTGAMLASWSRDNVHVEDTSTLAAAMVASLDTLLESLGGPSSQSLLVTSGERQVAATKVGDDAFLFLIAPSSMPSEAFRNEVRRLEAACGGTSGAEGPGHGARIRADSGP